MNNMLETRHLKKYFSTPAGPLHAVDDVSLTVREGKTLGIVGESGCGKSTLGRAVLRLIEPTDGQVLFNGENILKYNKQQMLELRKQMQIIFQDPYSSLNPRMNVSQLITEPLKVNNTGFSREETEERIAELMRTVGLAERLQMSYPHELDGGRRQRVGIARALTLNPRLIVCDEPVSALDVSIQAQILNLLMDLQDQRGLTYLFITHNLAVVKHISDDIAVMYLGQCIEKAPSRDLFKNPLHPYTKALLDSIPTPTLKKNGRQRTTISGELISPVNPAPGCRFAPRCPRAVKECLNRDFPLVEIEQDHFVACRLYGLAEANTKE